MRTNQLPVYRLLRQNGETATIQGADGQPIALPIAGTVGDGGRINWGMPEPERLVADPLVGELPALPSDEDAPPQE